VGLLTLTVYRIRLVSAEKIVIFGPAPEYNPEVPRLIAKHNTREDLEQSLIFSRIRKELLLLEKYAIYFLAMM
jgi:hypothetical protein